MAKFKLEGLLVLLLMADSTSPFYLAETDPRDVEALHRLYLSLNIPPSLAGWVSIGGDPCVDQWLGVFCALTNVTQLILNDMHLEGTLGDSLDFPSMLQMNFNNNHISGTIPPILPPTLTHLSLSNNALIGGIPDVFEQLTVLQEMDLSANNLSGSLPPSTGSILSLKLLDLSNNNLSDLLPSSMVNMLSLNSLYLQDNKLTGLLDVLQGLPLTNLDVEHNFFSGPIPAPLLNVPNFRKDGNPFNTTVMPSPPSPQAALPPSLALSPYAEGPPKELPNTPSVPSTSGYPRTSNSGKASGSSRNKMVLLIVVAGITVIIIVVVCMFMSIFCKIRHAKGDTESPHEHQWETKDNGKSSLEPLNRVENAPQDSTVKVKGHYVPSNLPAEMHPKPLDGQDKNSKKVAVSSKHTARHYSNAEGMEDRNLPLAAPPGHSIPSEISLSRSTEKLSSSSSLKAFTIAALQQYTDSFSEENCLGEGQVGSVYRAKLPNGMLLAVKKLKSTSVRKNTDEEFDQLVISISKIRHANILEIIGYCNEYGERLLVYEYCRIGSLQDALQIDDEIRKMLTWNARVRVALGAARALLYLHEVCQPPIVHHNFTSANILLDDKLAARVSDCGLHPLMSSASDGVAGQGSSSQGYSAPELELGIYTCKSDIYSFGVVMLELLTGRKSYDRSQSRGAQSLVRWAVPRLHDIDALSRMVDPSLKGSCPIKSLSRFADIISRCIQWEPEFRPPISEIVQDLLQMV